MVLSAPQNIKISPKIIKSKAEITTAELYSLINDLFPIGVVKKTRPVPRIWRRAIGPPSVINTSTKKVGRNNCFQSLTNS